MTSDTPDQVTPLTAGHEYLVDRLFDYIDAGQIPLADGRALVKAWFATLDAARQSDGAEAGLDTAMRAYFASRGSAIPTITTGRKAIEEAEELVDAIAEGDQRHIREEVADLALVAAVVAAQYGSTVESCIAEKAGRDTGRGEPKQDPRAALQAAPVSIDQERLDLRPALTDVQFAHRHLLGDSDVTIEDASASLVEAERAIRVAIAEYERLSDAE